MHSYPTSNTKFIIKPIQQQQQQLHRSPHLCWRLCRAIFRTCSISIELWKLNNKNIHLKIRCTMHILLWHSTNAEQFLKILALNEHFHRTNKKSNFRTFCTMNYFRVIEMSGGCIAIYRFVLVYSHGPLWTPCANTNNPQIKQLVQCTPTAPYS